MLSIGGSTTRVYLAVGATDMRKGIDGLTGLIKSQLDSDPLSGHLFVFCNAGRTRLKLIYFDGTGYWVCAKRLERGRFEWPQEVDQEKKIVLSGTELAALVDGLELTQTRAKRWWRRKVEG